jgi:hypothetical protein
MNKPAIKIYTLRIFIICNVPISQCIILKNVSATRGTKVLQSIDTPFVTFTIIFLYSHGCLFSISQNYPIISYIKLLPTNFTHLKNTNFYVDFVKYGRVSVLSDISISDIY